LNHARLPSLDVRFGERLDATLVTGLSCDRNVMGLVISAARR